TSLNDPTKPVPAGVRWFWNNHQSNLQKTKANNFDLCFLGDSITSGWPGDLMNMYFGKYKPANFGIGGDRAENVLFRLENGELQWTSPKVIILLLGTNNSGMNNPAEIALGVANVIRKLRGMLPDTKILLLAIFPSKDPDKNQKTNGANTYLAKMDDGKMVRYLDINAKFMNQDGKLRNDVMRDEVHLNRNGYIIWGENIAQTLDKMMK
ncbi:MAG: GDSL family lipase, partial [Opitutae bacterium]|nr:GDSL family lipase [Opitutae bacterium]